MSVRPSHGVGKASTASRTLQAWVALLLGGCFAAGSGCSAPSGAPARTGLVGCTAPLEACGDACVNTASDPANCGDCGHACAAGLFCSLGSCSSSCAAGTTACGAACVDLANDTLHCGSCEHACGAAEACSAGACVCPGAGQISCSGSCIDPQSDNAHCGSCDHACSAGQSCNSGVCSGGAGAGGAGSGGAGGSGGSSGAGGSGNGVQVGGTCFPLCMSALTDPDGDGYGQEAGRSCVVPGSAPSQGAPACTPPPPATTIPPGDGFYLGGTCFPPCASDATDPDPVTGARDGYGYEMGRTCIVSDSAPALQGVPCIPPDATTGDGYLLGTQCVPACTHPELADAQGYGYEAQQTCVVPGSMAALQNARCTVGPRTLPPPGPGTLLGQTCFPPCGPNAIDLTADGYGFDQNRTCVVAGSTATIQGLPCVPPPPTVTGDCPRALSCPVVNGVNLQCGCTWVDGLMERKQQILGTAGSSQYFVASAMLETASLLADYTLGDGKTGDAFNAGICKQNWGMIRRCHPAWTALGAAQFMTSTAMNSDLGLDVQVYNECRAMFGPNWWSGHRAGFGALGQNTQDIQQFKAGMDWINLMLTGHLADDVRFWVAIQPI